MELIVKSDEGAPHVWFSSLMVVSYALQMLLKDGHKVSDEAMREIFARAMDIADSMRINVSYSANDTDTTTPEPPKSA